MGNLMSTNFGASDTRNSAETVSVVTKIEQDLQRLYNHWHRLEANSQWHVLEDFAPRLTQYYKHNIRRIRNEKQREIANYQKIVHRNSQNRFSFTNSSVVLSKIKSLERDCGKLEQFEIELLHQSEFMQGRVEQNREAMRQLTARRRYEARQHYLSSVNHRRGLDSVRMQKFHQFQADKSFAGERCGVCFEDIEVGMAMVRLDCEGEHVFCRGCVEKWFKDHKTCPICRCKFEN